MKSGKKHKRELKINIFLSLIGIVILQICIVTGVFALSGIIPLIDENSVRTLSDAVSTKKNAMESQMLEWSRIGKSVDKINAVMIQMEMEEGGSIDVVLQDKSNRNRFLQQTTDIILQNLRDTKATESFLILTGDKASGDKDALYFRDRNPIDNPENNLDILAEAGMSSLIIPNGVTLDSFWTSKLPIDGTSDFYHKPIQAGITYPDMETEDLGYWSSAFRLREKDIEMITYTMPLLSGDNKVYGIVGIGVSLDYFNYILAQNEIGIDNYSSYYLGVTEDGTNYKTVLAEGSYYNSELVADSILRLEKRSDQLYDAYFDKQTEAIAAAASTMKLYNTNTPFEMQQWGIVGLVRENILFESLYYLKKALVIALLISFVVSFIGAIFLTTGITNPLHLLMKSLKGISVHKIILSRTGVKEFDELAGEIERLSASIYKAGSKVADIIEKSDLSLGICEFNEGGILEKNIFCTKKFMEILQLPMGNWSNNYINKAAFLRLTSEIHDKAAAEPEEADTHWFIKKDGNKRFIKVKIVEDTVEGAKNKLIIVMDVTSEIEEKHKIMHDRDYDVLTNLYNRRAFVKKVTALLDGKICKTGVLSIWDLDNLKYMNDTYGHDIGDQYIRLLADTLRRNHQSNLITARMSGDEFMVFMYNQNVDEICAKLRDIHSQFIKEKITTSDGQIISVSVSAGMSIYKTDAYEFGELLRYADFAMYEVKKKEKGAISLFDRDSYVKDYILVQGVGELNRILGENSIKYAFQPIVDVKNQEIFGYEALMRPISELLSVTTEFLRLAETQSKLKKVERMTWFCAIAQFAEAMKEIENNEKYLFINSIPKQCLTEEDFAELENLYGSRLGRVVMEITETAEVDFANSTAEQAKSKWCEKWKIQTALDDYGSGYSNSGVLLSSKFDYVKIDMSMIRGIDSNDAKQTMAASIIEYCHSNDIKVIAEGIETKEELEKVIQLGTDYVQGYYLAKPSFKIQTTLG